MSLVLVDTNLLLLLIVGRTERSYIGSHKRTVQYDSSDMDVLESVIAVYDGVVTTPHILAEASNLLRQIRNPARDRIQQTLREFILTCKEQPVASTAGCLHDAFVALGLTDAVILTACTTAAGDDDDNRIDLLTADEPMYNRALSLGLPAELYA